MFDYVSTAVQRHEIVARAVAATAAAAIVIVGVVATTATATEAVDAVRQHQDERRIARQLATLHLREIHEQLQLHQS